MYGDIKCCDKESSQKINEKNSATIELSEKIHFLNFKSK